MFRLIIVIYALVALYTGAKVLRAGSWDARFKWLSGPLGAPWPVVLVCREMHWLERPLADVVYAGAVTAGVGYLLLAWRYETTRTR